MYKSVSLYKGIKYKWLPQIQPVLNLLRIYSMNIPKNWHESLPAPNKFLVYKKEDSSS